MSRPAPDTDAGATRAGTLANLLRALLLLEVLGAAAIAAWLNTDLQTALPLAAALGIAAPIGAHAGIIAIDFAITSVGGSPTPAGHRLGASRAVALYVHEFVDSVRTFQFAQPLLAGRPLPGTGPRRWAPGDPLPVLLIHGYFCNRQVWRPMARALWARGHAVDAVDLEPVFGSIDDYVPRIAAAVDALLARTGAPAAQLLCHSMGGLAARAYLSARGRGRVARVVTLGSPHRGTFLARLGHGENTRQMRPGSDWLAALAAREDEPTAALFCVILSHHDNIVAPQAGQTLSGARTIELSGLGHITLAYDGGVRARVLALLGAESAPAVRSE